MFKFKSSNFFAILDICAYSILTKIKKAEDLAKNQSDKTLNFSTTAGILSNFVQIGICRRVFDGFCCINFQVAFCCNQFFNCLGLIYLFTTFCVFDIISLANKFCSIARVGASHCLAPHDLLNGN